jgi:hypothetical protein
MAPNVGGRPGRGHGVSWRCPAESGTNVHNFGAASRELAQIPTGRFSTEAVDKPVEKHARLAADRCQAGVATLCLQK